MEKNKCVKCGKIFIGYVICPDCRKKIDDAYKKAEKERLQKA